MGALCEWLDLVPGRVVNRSKAGVHNGSRPLHEAVIRELGLCVPDSLTSSNVDELRRFIHAGES